MSGLTLSSSEGAFGSDGSNSSLNCGGGGVEVWGAPHDSSLHESTDSTSLTGMKNKLYIVHIKSFILKLFCCTYL